MSSNTAGLLGTMFGGVVGGIVASSAQQIKEHQFEQNQNAYYSSKSSSRMLRYNLITQFKKVDTCLLIILPSPEREDWKEKKKLAFKEFTSTHFNEEGEKQLEPLFNT